MGLFHWWTLDNTVKDRYGDRDLIAWHSPSFDVGKVTQRAGRTSRGSSSNTEKTFYVSVDRTVVDTSFSVSLWINIDSDLTSGYCSPFVIGNWNVWDWYSVRFGLVYYYANNKLAFNIANGTSYKTIDSSSAGITLERHKWYHIAAIYEYEKSISLYINGKKVAEQSTNIVPILAGYYCVGGNDTDHYAFDGLINDIKVYDHVLSPTEIKKLAQGLACHFTFNFEDFYTPVDYIESDGNQYIQTDVLAKTTLSAELQCLFTQNQTAQYPVLFGTHYDGPSTRSFQIYTSPQRADYYGQHYYDSTFNLNTKYILKLDRGKFIVNGEEWVTWTPSTSTDKSNYPIAIFAQKGIDGSVSYGTYSKYRLYSFKIWDNGELIRDFMPCVRNTDNKPGLYDWVTNTFYTNVNISSQTDFKAPYYTPVEYIESNATQKINLGYQFRTADYFELSVTPYDDKILCGGGLYTDNQGEMYFGYRKFITHKEGTYITDPDIELWSVSDYGSKQNIVYTNKQIFVNGKYKVSTTQDFTTTANCYLFCLNRNGSFYDLTHMRFYGMKIIRNNVLIHDFVPAVNLFTQEAGVFDTITKKFLTKESGDAFTIPTVTYTNMVDCSGYLIDGVGSNITESKDTAWGNSCAVFNGTNSQIVGSYTTDGLTNLTYAAWVYQIARTNERACICLGGTYFTIDDSGHLSGYAYGKSPAGYHTGSKVIPLSQWTHIAITWDDEYIHGYINGVEDFKVACTGTFSYAVNQQIGMEGSSSRAFNGKIADLRIYATALSAEDIKELYENRIEIDSHKNLFCGNIVERDGGIELTKENILNVENIWEEENKIEIEKIDNNIDSSVYDRLEYIESSGTQYIKTGVKGAAKWTHTIQFTKLNVRQLMGMNGSGGNYWGVSNANVTRGTQDGDYETYSAWSGHPKAGNKDIIIDDFGETTSDKMSRYLNGELKYGPANISGDISDTEYKILALGTNSFCCYAKLYNTICEQNGELVRNFIPVKRRIDNEIGLFDTITKEFYINNGTGTFIEGPVLKNRMIVNNIIEE